MIDISKPVIKGQTFVYEPTGAEVRLDWRVPTTAEMRAYITESGRGYAGKEISPDFPFAHGFALIVGIRDGDWADGGKPISSNPGSPDYRADWKDVLGKNEIARLFICGLAQVAYNGVSIVKEVATPTVPFPSSGNA